MGIIPAIKHIFCWKSVCRSVESSIHKIKTSISLLSSWSIHFQSIFIFHFRAGNAADDYCAAKDGGTDDENDSNYWFLGDIFPEFIKIHIMPFKIRSTSR